MVELGVKHIAAFMADVRQYKPQFYFHLIANVTTGLLQILTDLFLMRKNNTLLIAPDENCCSFASHQEASNAISRKSAKVQLLSKLNRYIYIAFLSEIKTVCISAAQLRRAVYYHLFIT